MIPYSRKNKSLSRNLRRAMTEPEVILWSRLRKKQLKNTIFYRQKPIGSYIADFCSTKEKLVIELDGGGHYKDKAQIKDKERDLYFTSKGFTVLRFANTDIYKNLEAVLKVIWGSIKSPALTGTPFTKGGKQQKQKSDTSPK